MQDFRIKKACLRLHATFYFIWVVIYGYKVLLPTDYMPPMMGGSGHLSNMYKNFP